MRASPCASPTDKHNPHTPLMNTMHCGFSAAVLIVAFLSAPNAWAVTLGQIDTFEDGTTQGWIGGLGIMGNHPTPPANALGGLAGPNDNYLRLTSIGGGGPGGRLSVLNLS